MAQGLCVNNHNALFSLIKPESNFKRQQAVISITVEVMD
jgi:hypothetical protein